MGRASLQPGSFGKFSPQKLEDGQVMVTVRYRRMDGVKDRARAVGKTAAAAERKLKERLPRLLSATDTIDPEVATFADVGEQWLKVHRLALLAPGTAREQERQYRTVLLPAFGHLPIAEVTPKLVLEHYLSWTQRWTSQARNVRIVLNKILMYATALEYIPRNPLREIVTIRKPKKEVFAPDLDELQTLRGAVVAYEERPGRMGPKPGPLLRDTIEMILGTSARIAECYGIRWQDVDLRGDVPTISIVGQVKEGDGLPKRWVPYTKTEAGRRTIPIDDYVVAILMRRMVENREGNPYVFHTRTGAPNGPQDVHRPLQNVRAFAGLPDDYVPHALRKSVATAIKTAEGIEAAQLTLGHANPDVTREFYVKEAMLAPDMRHVLSRLHGGRAMESDGT